MFLKAKSLFELSNSVLELTNCRFAVKNCILEYKDSIFTRGTDYFELRDWRCTIAGLNKTNTCLARSSTFLKRRIARLNRKRA